MDNKEIRRRNIAYLVALAPGPTALADRLGRERNQISQWTGGKNIGDKVARDVEAALGVGPGWLDSPQWPGQEKFSLQRAPQPARLDHEILHEAETLVLSDEAQAGKKYAPKERARQLALAYEQLAAEGGRLTVSTNRQFVDSAFERLKPTRGKASDIHKRSAAKRTAVKK